jgi:hypothetical protein
MPNVNTRMVTIAATMLLLGILSEISISSYTSITATNDNAERNLITQLASLNQTTTTVI